MKKALVVVDYQNDFVDGALGFPGAELLDKGIAEKVNEYAAEGHRIYYTMDTHPDNYLETREGRALPVVHCVIDTHGWDVYGETKKALINAYPKHLVKDTFAVSPHIMASLEDGFEEIELVGLVSNICVLSNAVAFQARYPQATIIVDAALCASFDPTLHEKTLDVMQGLQIKVINRA